MAPNCLLTTALRTPRAAPIHLPLFLVPSFAGNEARTPPSYSQSRSYAHHAKLPKTLPKNKRDPTADPNASRKHLKADFPMTTRKSTRDMNRKRGVSALRSTGPRRPLSIAKWPLPVPETNPRLLKEKRQDPQFDPRGLAASHGLWAFFYDKKSMVPPESMGAHGREWTYAELSVKSFEDLHALYWIAHKELNRIATNSAERTRLHAGYGDNEDETRHNTITETMTTILAVLRDRYESVEEAHRIVGSNFMADLNLDGFADHMDDDGDLLETDLDLDLAEPSPSPSEFAAVEDPPTKLKFQ